jgi:uncharacterized protein YfdQ (DUF2303 family)
MDDTIGLKPALEFSAEQMVAGLDTKPHPQGGEIVVVPKDYRVERLEPLAKLLHHVKQTVKLLDASSFIAYINTFKNKHTAIFADQIRNGQQNQPPLIIGVIDYHQKPFAAQAEGATAKFTEPVPDYGEHRVEFEFPFAEEWARWRAIDNKPMSQMQAAEFLEENFMDVIDPPNAAMLDVVSNLEAKKNVSFASGVRLQTGANQLTYAEEIESKGRGTLVIPAEFKIGVPVFYGDPKYEVRVLLRYRINEGQLTFTMKINRRQFVEAAAFHEVVKGIATHTEIVPYFGRLG